MKYLDFLGDGLVRELAEEFDDLMFDPGLVSMSELEAGVRYEPKVAARHFALGRRWLQDAKPVLARKAFERALELDPDDAMAHLGLACALEAMGMTQTAMDELSELLDHQAEFRPAAVALDYCSRKLSDPVLAEYHFESQEVAHVG